MTFDFDTEVNKLGTHSTKWEFVISDQKAIYSDQSDPKYGDKRLLPMWVADMDFKASPAIIDVLAKRVQHGVFGYCTPTASYYDTVINWIERRHNWRIESDWIATAPGVVPAINMIIQEFIEPGEKVLVQRPVYYPFFGAIENNGAEIVSNTLVYDNGRYTMDFADLAQKAADPAVKMAILCNPHNPVARVWTQEELTRFGEICLENDVLVIADEVHCDLIYKNISFTPFASISEAFADNSFTCMATSKSFNLAGLKNSNIIIPDEAKRARFEHAKMRNGLYGPTTFGIVGTEAAYQVGEPWLEAVMAYIEDNFQFMASFLAEHLPQLCVIQPEGTYLVWVDFRALGLDPTARRTLLFDQARVYLDEGELFGAEGTGFERFNLACPRHILAEALARIATAVGTL